MKPAADRPSQRPSRMPEDSVLFQRIVPILFGVLAVTMLVLILFAIGVLIGLIPF